MRQLPLIFADFETRARVNLKQVGSRRYIEHPSFEVTCWVVDAPTRYSGWRDSPPPPLPEDFVAVAHNARNFERHVWRRLGWREPSEWVDTAELARMGGLPKADLDFLCQYFLGRRKDKVGSKLAISLSGPKYIDARGEWLPVPQDVLDRVLLYCGQDVTDLEGIFPHLAPWYANDLPGLREADRAINDRGFQFDWPLAQRLVQAASDLAARDQAAARITAEQARSVPQFTALLAEYGIRVPNCKAATLERVWDELHPDHVARRLIEARLSATPIASKKLVVALRQISPDGRLRDTTAYFGADRTGRWAGRGLQPHNLPKGRSLAKAFGLDDEQHALDIATSAVMKGAQPPDVDFISTLARACIVPKQGHVLVASDYNSIEARVLAWAAGDEQALENFRAGRNPYKVMAGTLYNVSPEDIEKGTQQYQLGKACELGCGYQMGHVKFDQTARGYGVDWSQVPVTPKYAVDAWRRLHWPVPKFWRKMQDAARTCADRSQPHEVQVGPVTWYNSPHAVHMRLPSGRVLTYHQMTATSEGLVFWGRKGREHTYGGKLTENFVQAASRDLLGDAIVKCEVLGMPVVLHVHDEIVVEVPAGLAEQAAAQLKTIMTTPPPWAKGLPLACSMLTLRRYQK